MEEKQNERRLFLPMGDNGTGSAQDETKSCAFCTAAYTKSPKFFLIDADNRVENIPVVLRDRTKESSIWMCAEHWNENKALYEKLCARDSFAGNPFGPDAVVAVYPPTDPAPAEPVAAAENAEVKSEQVPEPAPAPEQAAPAEPVDVPMEEPAKPDTTKVEDLAKLQRESLKFASAAMPPGMVVNLESVSDALSMESKSDFFDLSKLSPLFIQFLAWQRLMQIKQQISVAACTLSPEEEKLLAEIQKKRAAESVQTRHINPITPNYSLQKQNLPPGKAPLAKRHKPDTGDSVFQIKDTDMTLPDTPTKTESTQIGMGGMSPKDTFRREVDQKTKMAHLVGFNENIVICEMNKPEIIIGRSSGETTKPDLDLRHVVSEPKKLSHKHMKIVYKAQERAFYLVVISKNNVQLNDGLAMHGQEQRLNSGDVITLRQFNMTFVCPDDFVPPTD